MTFYKLTKYELVFAIITSIQRFDFELMLISNFKNNVRIIRFLLKISKILRLLSTEIFGINFEELDTAWIYFPEKKHLKFFVINLIKVSKRILQKISTTFLISWQIPSFPANFAIIKDFPTLDEALIFQLFVNISIKN